VQRRPLNNFFLKEKLCHLLSRREGKRKMFLQRENQSDDKVANRKLLLPFSHDCLLQRR
jgi:hypothetical protein